MQQITVIIERSFQINTNMVNVHSSRMVFMELTGNKLQLGALVWLITATEMNAPVSEGHHSQKGKGQFTGLVSLNILSIWIHN